MNRISTIPYSRQQSPIPSIPSVFVARTSQGYKSSCEAGAIMVKDALVLEGFPSG